MKMITTHSIKSLMKLVQRQLRTRRAKNNRWNPFDSAARVPNPANEN
ncbi:MULTISPECIES: hypothetical protein [Paenibacillus]|nr:hypothetical protein [Paenibacillus lautus]